MKGFVVENKLKLEPRSVLFIILPYLVKDFESGNNNTRSMLAFPYGALSIISYIKKNSKVETFIKILDLNLYPENQWEYVTKSALIENKPDIVGLSLMFDSSYAYLKWTSELVKGYNKNIVVLVGGNSATVSWSMIPKEQLAIDALCYGEGELPMLHLVESINIREQLDLNPVWVTSNKLVYGFSPKSEFLSNLNDVIDLDYNLIDIDSYGMKEAFSPFSSINEPGKIKQFFITTSRGCPFKCVFCAGASLHGRKVRYADVNVLIDHIKHLVDEYGMKVLTLYDDQLLINRKRAKEFFKRLAEFKIRVETPNGLSVAYIDEEMAAMMKIGGIDTAVLAIESGSERILRDVVHKPLRLDKVKPVVEILHRNDMFVHGYFVVGLPGEFEEDRVETLRFIREVELDWANFNLATPLRGSELYRMCVEKGYIDQNYGIGELGMHDYVINAPNLSPQLIKQRRYLMNLDINFVNNRRMRIGDYRIAEASFRDVSNRYQNHAFAFYFLAKSLIALGKDKEEIEQALVKVRKIVDNDPMWCEYFTYFGIQDYRDVSQIMKDVS